MAYSLVSESTLQVVTVATTATIGLTPTAGNALIVCLGQSGSAIRTYTVSDDVEGTTGWVQIIYANPSRAAGIWAKQSAPSGITTITVTASASTTFTASAMEWSGFAGTVTSLATDSLLEGATSTTHTCSAGGLTDASSLLAVTTGCLTAASTECAAGSGYTETPAGQANATALKQWQIFTSGCTSEVGTWTNTGTARIAMSAIALVAGAGGATGNPWYYYAQQ